MSDLDKEFINFQTKKSVHINLTRGTHSEFRSELFKRHLSMQEVFENLAILICEKDPYLFKVLDRIQEQKKEKQIKKLRQSDAHSIYKQIEKLRPFESNE